MLKRKIAMYGAFAFLLVFSIFGIQRIKSIDVQTVAAIPDSVTLLKKYPTVVIDAGHGGVDGGAVGVDGSVEKEINLNIALKLRDTLNFFGFETVMIREEDISVHSENASTVREKKSSDLHNRLDISNNTENSILISIHQNYFEQEKCCGTQVFYSPNSEDSVLLAQNVQDAVVKTTQQENTRQIKKAEKNLFILYNACNPAIMVECGFISNSSELELLKTDSYQQKLVLGIVNGIINYTACATLGE